MKRALVAGLLAFVALGGCSSGDGAQPSAIGTESNATTERYHPCSLLTEEQMAAIAGASVTRSGDNLSPVPARSCVRQDVLGVTQWTVRASYDVMAASRWAAALYEYVSTGPNAVEAVPILDEVIASAGLESAELSKLDDSTACVMWRKLVQARGLPVNNRITLHAAPGSGIDALGIASGETCQNGTYVKIVLQSTDAAEPDRVKKIEDGIRLLLEEADRVPTEG